MPQRLFSRRGFIASSSASLITAGISSCCRYKLAPLPSAATPPSIFPQGTGKLAIDAHCHVFNGTDLQVKQFIRFNQDLPFPEALRKIAGEIVQALTWNLAPTGCDEYNTLGDLAHSGAEGVRGSTALAGLRDRAYTNFRKEMQKTPAYREGFAAERSKTTDERSRYLRTIRNLVEAPTLEGYRNRKANKQEYATGVDSEAAAALIDFLLHGFNYRFVNVLDYLQAYNSQGSAGRSVDLMIANLVDFDWPLDCGGGTKTSFQDQIAAMERLSVFSHGRIHAMVPFDPMRAVAEDAGMPLPHKGHHLRFEYLKNAILNRGFIGVKLYPVMGFKPARNAACPANTWGKPWQPSWMGKPVTIGSETKSFGEWLDVKLNDLYRWCAANDVPITLHADPSQGPDRSYDSFPFDESWRDVLSEYKGLRVNFGHLGNPTGDGTVTSNADSLLFPYMVGPNAESHVYGDLSYPSGALARPSHAAAMLQQMFTQAAAGAQIDLHDRVLYGTDWLMLLLEKNSKDCLSAMESAFAELDNSPHQGASYADRFFALNAIEWLGLAPNGATRRRLEDFYRRSEMDLEKNPPHWMAKVDALVSTSRA